MSDTDRPATRPHSETLECWCKPIIFAICEACQYTGECDLGIPCVECRGTCMVRLEGDTLAEVSRQFLTETHPDHPPLVVLHFDPFGVAPRLIPRPEPDYPDDDSEDDDDELEPWEQSTDAWKK